MLTQKKIKSVVPSREFSKEMISWLADNAERVATSFEKKFPRSHNTFNIVLRNMNGSDRTVVLNSEGEMKFYRTAASTKYKNVISWQNARKLGCPTS